MADKNNKVTMEIIDSVQFKRANIRFNGIPEETVRNELKNEGWFYSKNHNVWYPKNNAAENSRDFARYIQETYFPSAQEVRIVTEVTERDELVSMLQNGTPLNEIISKIADIYGEDAVHEAFSQLRNTFTSQDLQPLIINKVEAEEEATNESPDTSDITLHTTEDNIYPDDVNEARAKLSDIIRETFLEISEEEKDSTTTEAKEKRYNTWFRPMTDEIMEELSKGNTELIKMIQEFDLNKESHIKENKWYKAEEAYKRDVQYKLLPELYEITQNKIKEDYDKNKIPYVMLYSSESPVFPCENKIYTVKEFNELLLKADSEFHNRKKYAEEKYGSADNYWDLESEDKLPEEDKGIQFGYDKTNFKFFNIPNPLSPEDTFSYEPSRYDIGDGNGSVFDYVRATCSHDEFIEAINCLENKLYFDDVSESQKKFVEKAVKDVSWALSMNLKDCMQALDKAEEAYTELHKKWLIEASEAEKVDQKIDEALKSIEKTYETSFNDLYSKVLNEYPFASSDISGTPLMQFTANEAKKIMINELYLPSRNAQKAMNAEDYATYNSINWAKLRRIWERFPSPVNLTDYSLNLLHKCCNEKGMTVNTAARAQESSEPEEKIIEKDTASQPSLFDSVPQTVLTEEDLELCKKVIPPSQYGYTLELMNGEEGEFFKNKLKEIADTYRKINTDTELINEDETHPLGFRYFVGNTEIFISEIDSQGIGFGFNILNGDYQMAEWGYTSMDEILSIPFMEMDYHVPQNSTIENMLYKEHPQWFSEYGNEQEEENKTDKKPLVDFFVANNIEFEDELYSGLNLEQAIERYKQIDDAWGGEISGFIPCIGIDTHDGSDYDSGPEGHGQVIFTKGRMYTDVLEDIPHFGQMKEYKSAIIALYDSLKSAGYEFSEKETSKIEKLREKESESNTPHVETPIYTFSPFGYDGSIVFVETDFKDGIPSYDIVGLYESCINETRERIKIAFANSGLNFPEKRVLQALSPADIKKNSPLDLSMALSILAQTENYTGHPVMALGELELSGNIRPVRGAVAAAIAAKANGINDIICDPQTASILRSIDGINILEVSSLKEANEKLHDKANFIKNTAVYSESKSIQFNEELWDNLEQIISSLPLEGHFETVRAIEIACAGKHNILTVGAPGCGKTLLTTKLMPLFTPLLTEEESKEPQRIRSISGLDSPEMDHKIPFFRMPHQTASIEGICGGGPDCRPGEITLAHKGTLYLDEAAEFRSSVLQMLRVPLENKNIALSRGGRSTVYPADFQLAMSMNPCPCGCYGTKDKICLDSARSIEMYWKKISNPLLDRIEIKAFVEKDEKDTRKPDLKAMKEKIRKAYEIQRERGVYNNALTPEDIEKYCELTKEGNAYMNKIQDNLSPRSRISLLRLSLTIANMDGRTQILINDLKEARELSAPIFDKPKEFSYHPENETNITPGTASLEAYIDDVNISSSQVEEARKERKRITEPVLNGEKSGMYKAFKDFENKGVFDVKGTQVKLSKNGGLTQTGWKQLQAAMEIYRSKKFETFRYIMIDRKTGEIADQLAITSHMPNFCRVSKANDETLKQVISRAEEKDYLIAVCHNHPSGNTTESSFDRELTDSLDRSLRRNDGMNRFAGHIILDHDTFNLALPNEKAGNCKWKKIDPLEKSVKDRFVSEPEPQWAGTDISGPEALKKAAIKINDTDNWNDDFIPVVFTNADRVITGVQYYSKNFFENSSEKIRNEFKFASMEAGAINAFPVITDSLWNKLSTEEQETLVLNLKEYVTSNAFTDASFGNTTVTEKYGIDAGDSYFNSHDRSEDNIEVAATWDPEINPRLFPSENVVGEQNSEKHFHPRTLKDMDYEDEKAVKKYGNHNKSKGFEY